MNVSFEIEEFSWKGPTKITMSKCLTTSGQTTSSSTLLRGCTIQVPIQVPPEHCVLMFDFHCAHLILLQLYHHCDSYSPIFYSSFPSAACLLSPFQHSSYLLSFLSFILITHLLIKVLLYTTTVFSNPPVLIFRKTNFIITSKMTK